MNCEHDYIAAKLQGRTALTTRPPTPCPALPEVPRCPVLPTSARTRAGRPGEPDDGASIDMWSRSFGLRRGALRMCRRRFGAEYEIKDHTKPPVAPYEGWEPIVYPGFAVAGVMILAGFFVKPNTDINDWALDEAEAREARRENGLAVEYGKVYSSPSAMEFVKPAIGDNPEVAEK